MRQHASRVVNNRGLHARTEARVKTQNRMVSCRCGKKQITQIFAKDADCRLFRALPELFEEIALNGKTKLHAPCPAADGKKPHIRGAPGSADAEEICETSLRRMRITRLIFSRELNRHRKESLPATTQNGKRAMRRDFRERLPEIEIITEFFRLFFFRFHETRDELTARRHESAQIFSKFRIKAEAFSKNVSCAIKRCLSICKPLFGIDEGDCFTKRIQRSVRQKSVGERFETRFLRNGRARAALALIGRIEVFELLLGLGVQKAFLQGVIELALSLNCGKDCLATIIKLSEIHQTLFERPQLRIRESAGHFLAVAGNKRNGCAFVEESDGSFHLRRTRRNFFGNMSANTRTEHVGHFSKILQLRETPGKALCLIRASNNREDELYACAS